MVISGNEKELVGRAGMKRSWWGELGMKRSM
jgi:hypothetical protein